MNNIPASAVHAPNAPWNQPDMPHGVEECADCAEIFPRAEMHPFSRYSWIHRRQEDVLLCEHCVPRCGWKVCAYDEPCRKPAAASSEGGWCEQHDRESEALDAEEHSQTTIAA